MELIILGFSILLSGIISIAMYYDENRPKKFNKWVRVAALMPFTTILVSIVFYLALILLSIINTLIDIL